jgi:Dyp-type peroxidase family
MKEIKPLDPMDFANDSLFSDLQGNILKGHGRDHTTHIFIHFNAGRKRDVKKWLQEFSKDHVTSFKKQLKDRELYKRNKIDGGLFASVFISAHGYDYLFDKNERKVFEDPAFVVGMKERIGANNDPNKGKWEEGFRRDSHIMVLLADDNQNRMGEFAKELLIVLDKFSHICTVEYGHGIRNANGDGLEHFGYVDGISQPLFLKDEVSAYMSFHNTNEADAKFNPIASTDLVLLEDPYSEENDKKNKGFGSYFVFRKLEQHVQAFKKSEKALGLDELGGAYIVGRFEDGTPTIKSDEDGMIGSGNFNNFDYKGDLSGGKCPHFAHIRKMNPREDIKKKDGYEFDDHKSHIMARRGIPYGIRDVSTEIDPTILQMPKGDVGLLFMSYQKSIVNQFEFIQQSWSNDRDFAIGGTGIDPIIGESKDDASKKVDRLYDFPKNYGDDLNTIPKPVDSKNFDQFVDMKGGEYFFAPSISFLRNI